MSGLLGQILGSLSGEQQQSGPAVHSALSDVLNLQSSDGIGSLLEQARSTGFGQHVESWIGGGNNLPITAEDVQNLLSNQQVDALIQRTGLPVEAIMPLVAKLLPHAVDQATQQASAPGTGS
jgi:uncharacterized protein YidB (DUF937 family)